MSLYAVLLGRSLEALDPSVAALHCSATSRTAAGTFSVRRGRGAAWVVAALLRLPRTDGATAVALRVHVLGEEEQWSRWFGGRPVHSRQRVEDDALTERFGGLLMRFAVTANRGELRIASVGTRVMVGQYSVRLPSLVAPRVHAVAAAGPSVGPSVMVRVEICVPLVGRLLTYEGVLDSIVGTP